MRARAEARLGLGWVALERLVELVVVDLAAAVGVEGVEETVHVLPRDVEAWSGSGSGSGSGLG